MLTVYTKPECIQCDRTQKALTRDGVEYRTRDVTRDPEALRHITEDLGYHQAPVVVTDDNQHWSGYQPARLKQLATAKSTPDAATLTAAATAAGPGICR